MVRVASIPVISIAGIELATTFIGAVVVEQVFALPGLGSMLTTAIAQRTGNISCGTSVFLMAVLERSLTELHTEIDMVTTPDGSPVAMVHSNNGASELDAWVGWFADFARLIGADVSVPAIYDTLYNHALTGEADAGGVLAACVLLLDSCKNIECQWRRNQTTSLWIACTLLWLKLISTMRSTNRNCQ